LSFFTVLPVCGSNAVFTFLAFGARTVTSMMATYRLAF
jgi:hypothetical protein